MRRAREDAGVLAILSALEADDASIDQEADFAAFAAEQRPPPASSDAWMRGCAQSLRAIAAAPCSPPGSSSSMSDIAELAARPLVTRHGGAFSVDPALAARAAERKVGGGGRDAGNGGGGGGDDDENDEDGDGDGGDGDGDGDPASEQLALERRLDESFWVLVDEIERALALPGASRTASKAFRVRVRRWLAKLSLPHVLPEWKRERNRHARLLRAIVRGRAPVMPPFDRVPYDEPLRTLPTHLNMYVR